MDFSSYCKLLFRNIPLIISITLLSLIAGLILGNNLAAPGFNVTVFTTIGLKSDIFTSQSLYSYDDVRAADHFTETVQGWFKNSSFLDEISRRAPKSSGYENLSAARQEKQNLIINFTVKDQNFVEPIATAVTSALSAEIEKYNMSAGPDFQLALYGTDYAKTSSRLPFLVLFALISGLALAFAVAFLREYMGDEIMSKTAIERLSGKPADLSFKSTRKNDLTFMEALLEKHDGKKCVFVFTWTKSDKLANGLKETFKHKDVSTINSLTDPSALLEHRNRLHALIIKPGSTKTSDLRNALALMPEKHLIFILD